MFISTPTSLRARLAGVPPVVRRFQLYLWVPVLVPLVVFLPRIAHGGFTGDDWSNRAIMVQRSWSDIWGDFLSDPVSHRALHMPYIALYDSVLGEDPTLYLLWAVLTAGGLGVLIVLLLKRLGVSTWVAVSIATLGVLFPYSSVTKLWATAHVGHVSIALALIGVMVAIRGMGRAHRMSRVAHHAVALTLYFASVELYEIALPIICASGAIYYAGLGRRGAQSSAAAGSCRARSRYAIPIRWLVDLVLVVAWYLSIRGATDIAANTAEPISHRLGAIGLDGARNVVGAFVPFASAERSPSGAPLYSGAHFPATFAILGLVVVLALSAVLMATRILPTLPDRFRALSRWGCGAAVALVSGFAGWLAIIPANDYYRPVPLDAPALRVNVLAAFGIVGVVVCFIGAAATLASMVSRRLGVALAAFGLVAVGATYARHDTAEIRVWNQASTEQVRILTSVGTAYGTEAPKPETAVFLTDNAEYVADGAEVFYTSWSFRAALQLKYRDFTLEGVAHRAAGQYKCRSDGMAPFYLQYRYLRADAVARYGHIDLVSVKRHQVWHVDNAASCRAALAAAGLTSVPLDAPTPALGST